MRNWMARCGLVIVLCGCDGLADQQTDGVALATLRGTLALGQNVKPPGANLQVSVLWHDPIYGSIHNGGISVRGDNELPMPGGCDEGQLTGWRLESPLLEQSVRVDTDFPSGFTVELTEPPPLAALFEYPDGSGVSTASGDLVVYEDRNGNGRLDPSTIDVMSPDLVYGSSRGATPWGIGQRYQYTIVYLTGDAENEGDGKAGYSLVTDEPGITYPYPKRIGAQRLSEAMVDLTLDPTIYVQQMACSVMCKLDANDTIASPKQFFESDLGMEVDWGLGKGEWAWSRPDGDAPALSYAKCSKGNEPNGAVTYIVDLSMVITEGCTETTISQQNIYMTAHGDAGDLGCKEYGELHRSEQPVTP